jgi:hypothetical protein
MAGNGSAGPRITPIQARTILRRVEAVAQRHGLTINQQLAVIEAMAGGDLTPFEHATTPGGRGDGELNEQQATVLIDRLWGLADDGQGGTSYVGEGVVGQLDDGQLGALLHALFPREHPDDAAFLAWEEAIISEACQAAV